MRTRYLVIANKSRVGCTVVRAIHQDNKVGTFLTPSGHNPGEI